MKVDPAAGPSKRPRHGDLPSAANATDFAKGSATTASDKYAALVDRASFQRLSAEMNAFDDKREVIIRESRDILKASKQAIFSMHRGAIDDATAKLATADRVISRLAPLIQEDRSLRTGSFAAAMEEYAEAQCFLHFLKHGTLITIDDLPSVEREEYLSGVVDFTGEVGRYAVAQATKRDVAKVEMCRDLVEAISGELIQFSFRNGPLRKKYDSLKYNLKKLENTLYELSLIPPGRPYEQHNNDDDVMDRPQVPSAAADDCNE
ncbi:hypothetical protein H310_09261 [Aphanomyces invadans]|uniref:Translin n=1 Tax=Aphanomyces invadans TaxID=157072 RepID=A0A024TX99_9STRA|nr:hypothetical protein H310_09261 [Aphanomyces invadans]ETV97947.1 hypothetical protein H310_09261 [Aphanomyces invadans]|eukprot:XP_008873508.1 hypothetical protein H310_09261 [Aphanomyces invadans]